jgi:hypothetical protein
MNIVNYASQKLIDEFTKTNVVVTFMREVITLDLKFLTKSEKLSEVVIEKPEVEHDFLAIFRPFAVLINGRFESFVDGFETVNQYIVDPQYPTYFEDLKEKVIKEIKENINLRIGKWDILNYLTNLESELKEIKNNFKIQDEELYTERGLIIKKHDDPFEMNKFLLYENLNVKIISLIEDEEFLDFSNFEDFYRDSVLTRYWDIQLNTVEQLLRYIDPRKKVIEITDDYVKVINIFPSQSALEWNKSDTDFLELVTALLETKSISNGIGNLSRKDAIKILSEMFNIEIKDPESKLTRATSRKKDVSPYLTSLKVAFDNYAIKKEDKLTEIRG